jgi:hypothetical protein
MASVMAAPVGISIQFDRPISVMVRKNARAPGGSARARSSTNGSMSRNPMTTSDNASTTCSNSVRSFRRKIACPFSTGFPEAPSRIAA